MRTEILTFLHFCSETKRKLEFLILEKILEYMYYILEPLHISWSTASIAQLVRAHA